jgi:1-deoxy-D-xylulose-5-phosphate synthase
MLDSVKGPEDVRKLAPELLPRLAEEIRRRITGVVNGTGGHLASNLGAVEITIALHRAFDFSRDWLVFDVGHQCYAHKLITGRHERFETLRQKGGLSGFPSPDESPYDLFVTGHASTAISMALGLAAAGLGGRAASGPSDVARHRGPPRRAVALVGDGSISGGLAFEGLNHAGHLGLDLLVVLNDNEMAISQTVGALSRHLSRLRLDPRYNELRRELAGIADKIPFLREIGHRAVEAARHALAPGGVFQDFGFRYIGPLDGHDVEELERTFLATRDLRGPVLVHVCTQKGRGYAPAAADPTAYHSAAPVGTVPAKADPAAKSAARKVGTAGGPDGAAAEGPLTFTQAMAHRLCELGERDERVVAVTAAMPDGTGLSMCSRKWPDRCFDVGISEGHAVTFASGLARAGKRPVVAVYSSFLQRAYDSVFHDLCLQGGLGVTICVDRAGLVGPDGPTHHGLYDVAYLRTFPGIVLLSPRDGTELAGMLEWAVDQNRPVAISYPRAKLPLSVEADGGRSPVELGRSEILARGERVAVLAYGALVNEAASSLRKLEGEGVRATLVNARFAKPLDEGMLREIAKDHECIVTVEEGALAGGFGSAVMEAAGRSGWSGACRVRRLGVPDEFIPHAARAEQLAELGLDAAGIERAVREAWGRNSSRDPVQGQGGST